MFGVCMINDVDSVNQKNTELFLCCTNSMLCNSRTIDDGMLKVCMHIDSSLVWVCVNF